MQRDTDLSGTCPPQAYILESGNAVLKIIVQNYVITIMGTKEPSR